MSAKTSEPLLRVRNLSKQYVQRRAFTRTKFTINALDDVNLTLERGATLAVVGASGAGKSTLIRCMAMLETPTRGEIRLDGVNLLALKRKALFPVRRKIQLIFQDPSSALNPALNAGEIIAEPLVIQHEGTRAQRKRRAREMMEQMGLPAALESKLSLEFSGGQRQRLAIARALILEPKILILDEALSHLDLANRDLILRLLHDLQDTHGLAYIHVCHDLRVVSELDCEVAVMHEGKIVEQKPAAELFQAPEHSCTQELLSAMPSVESIYEERFA